MFLSWKKPRGSVWLLPQVLTIMSGSCPSPSFCSPSFLEPFSINPTWVFTAHAILLSPLSAQSHLWTIPHMHCLFQMEFWLIWDSATLAICCRQKRDEAPHHKRSFLRCPLRKDEGPNHTVLTQTCPTGFTSPSGHSSQFQYFCKMSSSTN